MSGAQQHDNVLVFWESPNGKDAWKPVPRDNIPEWLRDEGLIDRMVGGEALRNATVEERWWKVTVVDRKPVVSPLAGAPQKRFCYIHQPGCDCVAFYLSRRPAPGQPMNPGDMIKVDGSLHDPREPLLCGACGAKIGFDVRSGNIVEMS